METPDPLLGRVIAGKLKLLELLGSGAMGKVYRAHHEALDKTVAIKVLHQKEGAGSQLARRFKAEARAASRLDHPNSLRILDFGEDGPDGLLYIAMEFLDGEDLSAVLRREGRLDGQRSAEIMAQVLAALSVAHQQGIVHRDMKPGNIMLLARATEQGVLRDVVKVCDFGLAKVLDAPAEDASGAPLTKQGAILGTPAYMSPEQASGEKTDQATDIYSCGVILYVMLSGRPPFTAESATGLLMKHILEEPAPLTSLIPDVDPRLAAIAHKAMAKKKEARFLSSRDMMNALREVVKDAGGLDLPPLARSPSVRSQTPIASPAVLSSGEKSDPYANTFVREEEPPAAPVPVATPVPPARAMSTAAGNSSIAPAAPPASKSTLIIAVLGSVALFFAGVAATMLIPRAGEAPANTTAALPAEEPPPVKPVVAVVEPEKKEVEPPVEVKKDPEPAPELEKTVPKTKFPRKEKPKEKVEEKVEEQPPPVVEEKPPVVEEKPAVVEEKPPVVEEKPPVVEREPKLETPTLDPSRRPQLDLKPAPEPKPTTVDAQLVGLEVTGGISTTRTMGALDRQLPMAKKCIETVLLPLGKKVKGEIKVKGRIDAYGKLSDLTASGDHAKLEQCVSQAIQSARLPKPDTGDARISFAIRYNLY